MKGKILYFLLLCAITASHASETLPGAKKLSESESQLIIWEKLPGMPSDIDTDAPTTVSPSLAIPQVGHQNLEGFMKHEIQRQRRTTRFEHENWIQTIEALRQMILLPLPQEIENTPKALSDKYIYILNIAEMQKMEDYWPIKCRMDLEYGELSRNIVMSYFSNLPDIKTEQPDRILQKLWAISSIADKNERIPGYDDFYQRKDKLLSRTQTRMLAFMDYIDMIEMGVFPVSDELLDMYVLAMRIASLRPEKPKIFSKPLQTKEELLNRLISWDSEFTFTTYELFDVYKGSEQVVKKAIEQVPEDITEFVEKLDDQEKIAYRKSLIMDKTRKVNRLKDRLLGTSWQQPGELMFVAQSVINDLICIHNLVKTAGQYPELESLTNVSEDFEQGRLKLTLENPIQQYTWPSPDSSSHPTETPRNEKRIWTLSDLFSYASDFVNKAYELRLFKQSTDPDY